MAAACAATWFVAAVIVDRRTSLEIFFGMLAPLAAASGTWLLVWRVYKERPEQLTGLMAAAFGVKMVFFGTYVALMLVVMRVRPVPFVASFTGYFVALYLIEALYMRRLFSERSK